MGIITLLIIGLIAGALARLIVPGNDSMGLLGTLVLGVIGSFVGGFLGYAIMGADISEGAFQPAGIVGALIGSIVALLVWRAVSSRRTSRV